MEDAIALLEDIRRLMELKGENPFKVRAYEKAASALAGKADLAERAKAGTLTELDGIGKGIAETLTEFLLTGKSKVRDELAASLPAGLVELTAIPGVGPKKALLLIEELGIHSVAELEYACRENRLLKLTGFGDKLQKKILDGIQFHKASAHRQRISDAAPIGEAILKDLLAAAEGARVSAIGELRRLMETLETLDYLIELPAQNPGSFEEKFRVMAGALRAKHAGALQIRLLFAPKRCFGYELARLTGSPAHWQALGSPEPFEAATENDFYARLRLPVIPPELRETGDEVALARGGSLAGILPWQGIQGVFHNHTTRSDGTATLEEMVHAAKKIGYRYIGISDHSQTAFYAQGLKADALAEQEKEIREVQDRHPEIRVFWGIESDILADGSLDYEPALLKRFDFVIASIHSRFQMDRETMTGRIVEAIRNPCTRFLGHATGRLLLGRKGYDVNMEKIIAEAAKHDVAIEINANPARLDIDWRWGGELRRQGTLVSVNPDAHEIAGLEDTVHGVAVARKALLPAKAVVNSRPVNEVEKWLRRA